MNSSSYVKAQKLAVNQFVKSQLVSTDSKPVTVSWVSLDGEVLLEQTYPLGVHKPADLRSAVPDAVEVEITGGEAVGHGIARTIRHSGHSQTSANPNYQAKPVDPAVLAMRREFAALQGEVRRLRSDPATHRAKRAVTRAAAEQGVIEVKGEIADDEITEFDAQETDGEKAVEGIAPKEKEKQD